MMEQLIREGMIKVAEMLDLTLSDVGPSTVLLDCGLDSMAFAMLVVELEESLGFDPFQLDEEIVYPETFEQLVNMYVKHG